MVVVICGFSGCTVIEVMVIYRCVAVVVLLYDCVYT